MALVVSDFAAAAKPIHFRAKKILQFSPRGLIISAGGQ
jgi:hypothetical protein